MTDRELVRKIEQSLDDGYRPREISKVLTDEGYDQDSIRRAFKNVKKDMERQRDQGRTQEQTGRQKQPQQAQQATQADRQKQGKQPQQNQRTRNDQRAKPQQPDNTPGPGNTPQPTQQTGQTRSAQDTGGGGKDVIKGIDLTGSEYTVKQKLIRNKYRVYTPDGDLVLKAKQKLFKLKENLPFKNPDGDVVFRVKGENIIDTAGDYVLQDEETEEPIVMLDRKWTLFMHRWRIRDPEDEALLAKVEGDRKILEALRVIGSSIPYFPNIFALLPHRYRISDHNDNELGHMQGKFSLRDTYELRVQDSDRAPREGLIAAAIAIDALEGN